MTITYGEIVKRCMTFVNDDSPGAESYVRYVVEREYRLLARSRKWRELQGFLDAGFTFTANQKFLVLPGDAADIESISDSANLWPLKEVTLPQLVNDQIATLDTTAPVIYYAIVGYSPIQAPLSADTTVSVKTASASDTSKRVRVTGLMAAPEITSQETITTDAATPNTTSVAGTITFREGWSIDDVTLDDPTTSYVILHESADATKVLANVSADEFTSRYLVLRLQGGPTTSDALKVVYKKRVRPLIDDSDVPVIPVEDALIEAGIAALRQRDEQYLQAREHSRSAGDIVTSAVLERRLQGGGQKQMRPDKSLAYRPVWR